MGFARSGKPEVAHTALLSFIFHLVTSIPTRNLTFDEISNIYHPMADKKIAIQGIKGSFHHIVADSYFGKDVNLVECLSFSEIPELILDGKVDAGVMAIENSIAGALLPNYALIEEYDLVIAGEYYLSIHHNLMGLKGQTIEDITEVLSHPMALLQCRAFFRNYPHIKLIEDKDTADVAKRIQDENISGVGAIASTMAADLYDLEILKSDIQTIKQNATRFVIVGQKPDEKDHSVNKASITFEVANKKGSLAEVLTAFSDNDVNLTKIQSLPIIEKPWEYRFFADLVFETFVDYQNAMKAIEGAVSNCKVLGEYLQS